MDERDTLGRPFEESRPHLRAVAYRMLGSLSEADDAVQEAWLRLSRSDTSEVENLKGWLTTVVARVCLDMLRSRKARPEDPVGPQSPEPTVGREGPIDPEQEALLADSVGLALLVVLDRLNPAERLAFVMHDMFAVPFEEIAPIVGRSPAAARQLASRARRRVQGGPAVSDADLARQREVVDAFLAALRGGDFDALLAVLDPDLVVRIDAAAVAPGAPREVAVRGTGRRARSTSLAVPGSHGRRRRQTSRPRPSTGGRRRMGSRSRHSRIGDLFSGRTGSSPSRQRRCSCRASRWSPSLPVRS